ncbi:MAG: hypothetical protein KC516_02905 [Nanoarchaeota archaeon]|nr:hypothetical protein [Nanoarchaeota archaeon]
MIKVISGNFLEKLRLEGKIETIDQLGPEHIENTLKQNEEMANVKRESNYKAGHSEISSGNCYVSQT